MFPRFYFVSDDSLLSILSNDVSMESVKPHLKSLFNDVSSYRVSSNSNDKDFPIITGVESHDGEILPLSQPVSIIILNLHAELMNILVMMEPF